MKRSSNAQVLVPGGSVLNSGKGASKVQVSGTVGGTTTTVPRDAQRLTTGKRSNGKQAKAKAHDVIDGGQWLQLFGILVYHDEPDAVQVGMGVEVTSKACKADCTRNHECRTQDTTKIETVGYIVSTGYSERKGRYYTKCVPLADPEAANERKIAKLKAQAAAYGFTLAK